MSLDDSLLVSMSLCKCLKAYDKYMRGFYSTRNHNPKDNRARYIKCQCARDSHSRTVPSPRLAYVHSHFYTRFKARQDSQRLTAAHRPSKSIAEAHRDH